MGDLIVVAKRGLGRPFRAQLTIAIFPMGLHPGPG